jgi:hypothetical protein
MEKKEALKNCLECITEYGYISEDGILDVCDEDMRLVRFCRKELDKIFGNGDATRENLLTIIENLKKDIKLDIKYDIEY